MPHRQKGRHDRQGGSPLVLQILDSHAIQKLIGAVSEFFGNEAKATKTRSKDWRGTCERRQHRNNQERQRPREHERYEDRGRYGDGRDIRRLGHQGMNVYYGPTIWSRQLTM